MAEVIADRDELRLLTPAGMVQISIKGQPIIRLRRPTVGELRRFLERWDELRNEFYEPEEFGRNQRRLREGKTSAEAQCTVGPIWIAEVIQTLSDGQHAFPDPDELPVWMTNITKTFTPMTNHWFEVPLASGDSANGSQPSASPEANQSLPPGPQMIGQVIPGGPVPGSSPSIG